MAIGYKVDKHVEQKKSLLSRNNMATNYGVDENNDLVTSVYNYSLRGSYPKDATKNRVTTKKFTSQDGELHYQQKKRDKVRFYCLLKHSNVAELLIQLLTGFCMMLIVIVHFCIA